MLFIYLKSKKKDLPTSALLALPEMNEFIHRKQRNYFNFSTQFLELHLQTLIHFSLLNKQI
jgi:hypothetical protein